MGDSAPVVNLNGEDSRVDEVLDDAFGDKADKAVEKSDVDPEPKAKEFKSPQTQEELDQLIQKRLQRVENKYKDYNDLKELANKLEALEAEKGSDVEKATRRYEKAEKELEKLMFELAKRERTDMVRDISDELGLPAKLRNRVQGDDEKSIRADIAELLDGLPVEKSTTAGPPVNKPKEKVKVSTGSGDNPPEWTADDLVKSIDRGGLRF